MQLLGNLVSTLHRNMLPQISRADNFHKDIPENEVVL